MKGKMQEIGRTSEKKRRAKLGFKRRVKNLVD